MTQKPSRGREIYMSKETRLIFEKLKETTGRSGASLVAEGLTLLLAITEKEK
jgi:hypothetical protein